MKRNSYDKRQKERREIFRERVKETEKSWPRITKTRTYEYFFASKRMMRVK